MPQDYSDANLAATVNSHSVSWVNDLKNSRLTWLAWSVTLCTLFIWRGPADQAEHHAQSCLKKYHNIRQKTRLIPYKHGLSSSLSGF